MIPTNSAELLKEPEGLYRNDIKLGLFSAGRNRIFLKDIWTEKSIVYEGGHPHLLSTGKWFDRLHGSLRRKHDPDMTLERFVADLRRDAHIGIEFGHHHFSEIRYAAIQHTPEQGTQFAWLICPYTEHNFEIISGIFSRSYGSRPESFPVSDANRQYYERLRRDYSW